MNFGKRISLMVGINGGRDPSGSSSLFHGENVGAEASVFRDDPAGNAGRCCDAGCFHGCGCNGDAIHNTFL